MKLQVFSVYDSAVDAYMPPFFMRSKGEAIRSFTEAVNDEKSNFYKHAADFGLFHVGDFDDANGSFTHPQIPMRVVTAHEVIYEKDLGPEFSVAKKAQG